MVLRNVVTVRLRPDHDPELVADLQERLRRLDCPGTVSYLVANDAGTREGNWSFVIIADFADRDSYSGYDTDAEHDRLRKKLAPMCEEIARIQVEL